MPHGANFIARQKSQVFSVVANHHVAADSVSPECLCIYFLKAYSPVTEPHRVTSGLKQVQISHIEYSTKYAQYSLYKSKTYKQNPKFSPFGIAVVKKKRQIKLGDAGTIDRFGLTFQYQI